MFRLEIALPKVGNDGALNDDYIAGIVAHVSHVAGGCTISDGSGAWSNNGVIVYDAVTVLVTFCDAAALEQLKNAIPSWRALLVQDALVYSVVAADITFVSK